MAKGESLETMVGRIDERTEAMDKKLCARCDQIDDHEKRIGGIEGFEKAVAAVVITLVTVVGWILLAGYFHAPF